MSGTLYGVGVGPGDPELLTIKAHRLICDTEVIAYPAPDDGVSFARSIVSKWLDSGKTEIAIIVPMRIGRFPAKQAYDQAAEDIASHLDSNRNVVVLCEGDPFFYGSFMYLYERLASRYSCEIVPGVSSLMASAAIAARPLAARNDVLTIIPAPLSDDQINRHLQASDAVAFIKVGRHFPRLRALINDAGLLEKAVYLERVTLGNQRLMPLADVDQAAAPYFSMVLIYNGAEDWISALPVAADTLESA